MTTKFNLGDKVYSVISVKRRNGDEEFQIIPFKITHISIHRDGISYAGAWVRNIPEDLIGATPEQAKKVASKYYSLQIRKLSCLLEERKINNSELFNEELFNELFTQQEEAKNETN